MTTRQPTQGTKAQRVLADLLRSHGDEPLLTDEERDRLRQEIQRRMRRVL